ncbi:hypothetical protein EUX98_g7494 [Antrodiella citrinella]|uniref:ML-like domain-containing protein n=1 Tax=Antrodiella citrinella TaxID=2447956 RepID=A0A4S4MTQ0_9APHY|nr:hypothetical protein EUX98_g7494 [Antrodiella citrinella]
MMFMKSIFALAAFATAVYAQSVTIAAPVEGTSVTAGQNFTVDIARPNTLSPSQEVAVVIGLVSCSEAPFNGNCASFDVSQIFGTILYNGPYTPTLHNGPSPDFIDFYQNFTLTVPSWFTPGSASLNVAHVSLIGAGPFPDLEVKNITLNVVAA